MRIVFHRTFSTAKGSLQKSIRETGEEEGSKFADVTKYGVLIIERFRGYQVVMNFYKGNQIALFVSKEVFYKISNFMYN